MLRRASNEAGLSRAAALLLGGRAQPHQVLPGLVRAQAVGRVLEDPLIGGDGLGGPAPQLLHARERKLHLVEEEVLGSEVTGHRLEGLDGLAPVALGLPGVADRGPGQHAHGRAVAARQRDLVGPARRRPLPRGVAQVAQLEGGLGHRGGRGMPREHLLELLLRARPRLGRRLRALGGVHAGHHLGVDGGDTPLLAVVPVPAAGGGREDDEHEGAGGDERAHRRQCEVHARACCGAPGAGSSQISPLTLAPSAAAERLPRTTPPMTIACAVMLASTRASGPTCSVPSSTMSPSNWPRSVSVPSPRSSPLIVTPVPMVAGEACAPWAAAAPATSPPRPKNASRRLIAAAILSGIAGRSAGSASSPRRRAR